MCTPNPAPSPFPFHAVNTQGLDENRRFVYKQGRAQTSGLAFAAEDTVQVRALWPARATWHKYQELSPLWGTSLVMEHSWGGAHSLLIAPGFQQPETDKGEGWGAEI